MKELYDDLKMELIIFDSLDDIITDSGADTGEGGDAGDGGDHDD